ncbi:MAG: hypothetical protein QHH12_08165 [Candidatus Bathyarchaeota archaeon]|jgi:hypothetical protein|nr:hypothetical protein [Candidatus Bathyarchaeota archaeon]
MGDISEIRGLVVVGTFLSCLFLLIAFMPQEFFVTAGEERKVEVPKYFESSDLTHWNFTYVMNITFDPYGDFEHFWGKREFGHDMLFRANKHIDLIWNDHGYTFLGIWTGGHKQDWINNVGVNRGDTLSISEIEADWNHEENLARYTVRCQHFYMRADFAYPAQYSSVSEAFEAEDLHVMFGINWDQRGTSWDAWSLVAAILFFRMPEINPYINAIIAIPIWIAVAYISFILVLRAIGAVFGGGA